MLPSASVALSSEELHCAQCGGTLRPDEGQLFLTCPYCASTVYLDKSKVVFHWTLASTLSAEAAAASLRRWMAGNQTVKDLDRKAQAAPGVFQYFPLWYVKAKPQGQEAIFLEPAAAISISEIKSLNIPAGDLQKYDAALDVQAVPPTVPFPAMLSWLAGRGVNPGTLTEAALVHVPIYIFKYQFEGKLYTALVEGASGKVFANLFPPKAEAPYYLVASLATAGFLLISSFPVIGYFVDNTLGLPVGLLASLACAALFAVPVFALAAYVSAKV